MECSHLGLHILRETASAYAGQRRLRRSRPPGGVQRSQGSRRRGHACSGWGFGRHAPNGRKPRCLTGGRWEGEVLDLDRGDDWRRRIRRSRWIRGPSIAGGGGHAWAWECGTHVSPSDSGSYGGGGGCRRRCMYVLPLAASSMQASRKRSTDQPQRVQEVVLLR